MYQKPTYNNSFYHKEKYKNYRGAKIEETIGLLR